MQLMSNRTPKMTQVPIEINANLHFPQIWHGQTFLKMYIILQMLKTYYLR